MGVEFMECGICGETFCDVGGYRSCVCGERACEDCMDEQEAKYGTDEDDDYLNKCDCCVAEENNINELENIKGKIMESPDEAWQMLHSYINKLKGE